MTNPYGTSSSQAIGAAISIAVTAFAAFTLFYVRDILSTPVIALLFLLPVLIGSSIWGLGAGVVSSICAFLAFNYLFIRPYYTLDVHQPQDILALFVFLGVAIVISQLVGRIRSSLAEVQVHLQEVTRLYAFSAGLASIRHGNEIAQRLASDLLPILSADKIEVIATPDDQKETFTSGISSGHPVARIRQEVISVPLATNRGTLGQVTVWRSRGLSSSEQQLLKAFASPSALAIERVMLEKHEARARVLEESDHFKSALLSSISHDLRTPLVTIKAAAASLRSGDVDWNRPARQDLLEALDEEADRLNQLVGDLLNLSRIDAGALTLQQDWYSVRDIVHMTVAQMKPRIGPRPMIIEVPEELPLVWIDQKLIERVFANLIENSLKYSPSETPIEIVGRPYSQHSILVEIVNSGPPVPDEHLESIFGRFKRVTEADRIPGTGLGLSICKGIIEAHKRRIWAENIEGRFAFKFTLPTTDDLLVFD